MVIYAVINRDDGEGTKKFHEWKYKADDYDAIYDRMMLITDNDHEISADIASWCELASVGEVYTFREGEVVIMEMEY